MADKAITELGTEADGLLNSLNSLNIEIEELELQKAELVRQFNDNLLRYNKMRTTTHTQE